MPGNGRRGTTHTAMRGTPFPNANGRSEAGYGRSRMRPRNGKLCGHASCSIGCGPWVVHSPMRSATSGMQGTTAPAAGFMQQRHGLVDNFMWANDYPHHEGTGPHSAAAIERHHGPAQRSAAHQNSRAQCGAVLRLRSAGTATPGGVGGRSLSDIPTAHYTAPAFRKRSRSWGLQPASCCNIPAVCSPCNGAGCMVTGDSDKRTGQPIMA